MVKTSTLKCGSGSAWIDDKMRFFKECREIRRGKNKGGYEVKIPHSTRGFRKVIVSHFDIRYLPRQEE